MHSLQDLTDTLGLSYQQVRNRVLLLEQFFNNEVKGGNGAQYVVTDNGLTILQRAEELHKAGNSLKQSFKIAKEESQDSKVVEQDKEELINQLKERIRFLEQEVEVKNNQIQQLLPKQQEQQSERRGIMQRFKDFLGI